MADIELKTNAPGMDKVINQLGQLTKKEQKAAVTAVGLGKALDKNVGKKQAKNVGFIEKSMKGMGPKLMALAGPGSIFAGFIAAARKNFEHMFNLAEKAKAQNIGYTKAKANLFRNDRLFADDKQSQVEFDNLFKEQGKKAAGLLNKLPTALANARSKSGGLKVTNDKEFLKAAVREASNIYQASQGESDLESDISAMAQIADRDKRNISAEQKVFAASAQLAQFQSLNAQSPQEAAKILPRVLPTLQNLGTKEQILGTQAFATNLGLTNETALTGIQTLIKKLEKKGIKGDTGMDRLLAGASALKSGKIQAAEFVGTEETILNAISKKPEMLQKFISGMSSAKNVTQSTAKKNLAAQIKNDPALKEIINASAQKGRAEVSNLQDTEGSKLASILGAQNDQDIGAGVSGVPLVGNSNILKGIAWAGKLVGLDNKHLNTAGEILREGEISGDIIGTLTGNNRKSTFDGVMSGELFDTSDGISKIEKERLRFLGTPEERISQLNRAENPAEQTKVLEMIFNELKIANQQRLDFRNQEQPGSDEL